MQQTVVTSVVWIAARGLAQQNHVWCWDVCKLVYPRNPKQSRSMLWVVAVGKVFGMPHLLNQDGGVMELMQDWGQRTTAQDRHESVVLCHIRMGHWLHDAKHDSVALAALSGCTAMGAIEVYDVDTHNNYTSFYQE